MSRSIPHRELRNSTSAVLRDVVMGESIEITNHGAVVVVLVPPGSDAATSVRMTRVIRRGGFSALSRVEVRWSTQDALDGLRSLDPLHVASPGS